LISTWVEKGIFSTYNNNKEQSSDDQLNLNDLKAILLNSIDDFDWETRCACVDVLTAIIRVNLDPVFKEWRSVFVVELFNEVIRKGIQDCEFKVQERMLHCLRILQGETGDSETGIVTGQNETIKMDISYKKDGHFENIEELIAFISQRQTQQHDKVFTSDRLRHLMTSCDFGRLILDLKEMDEMVKEDPVSFMEDIVASAKKADENLLDCY
jgi:hypothetical protein